MKFYIGVTDDSWFHLLAQHRPDEVNFWRPKDKSDFKVIKEGAPFLFKLKAPFHYIVGGGFFVQHLFLPLSLAWDAFGMKNGAETYDGFRQLIMNLRDGDGLNPSIGCTILTEPFFFERDDWIPIPANWSKNIVKGRFEEIQMNGDLPSTFTTDDGRPLTYSLLSHGTKDTVALAWRFALTEHLLQDQTGFIILDDPMVDMDPERRELASKAIEEFAKEQQVLVMTCHPEHAKNVITKGQIIDF